MHWLFKHYHLHFIRIHLKRDFPDAVSYNRFVELESRVFFMMMFFLNLHSFGRCTGITFVGSTRCLYVTTCAGMPTGSSLFRGMVLRTPNSSHCSNLIPTWRNIL